MIIGIGNVGSTSFKSKIIDIDDENNITVRGEANLDRIKTPGESNFVHMDRSGKKGEEKVDVFGFEAGLKLLLKWYINSGVISSLKDIEALGFKCVLGVKNGANELTPEVLEEMRRFAFVAPAHNMPYVETIGEFKKVFKDIPLVGVFEPSFHYSIPEQRRIMGVPWSWHYDLGIKKNGFHGSSHRYITAKVIQLMGTEKFKLISAHLGGSSSLAAIKDGLSVDTSMQFSPQGGVLQGSRIGDTDAYGVLYAMEKLNLSISQASEELSKNAGLKGIAGIGSDELKDISDAAKAGNERAKIALDAFTYGVKKYIGSLATVLEGLDVLAFAGGIGEKGVDIRWEICRGLEFMEIELDEERNKAVFGVEGLISSPRSKVKVYVIPTNEEVVVAYFTKKVVEEGRDLTPSEMVFRL
ncbi:MAG: acetate/propionate family kinase [Actinobacteria bacterium]|nr:acetate/propionate family kinase [Actinomycetota bacterium]